MSAAQPPGPEFSDEPGRYVLRGEDGNELAEVTYHEIAGGRALSLDGTHVADELRGQGVAGRLVDAVLDRARAAGQQVLPVCPYAVAVFRRHPELASLRYRPGDDETHSDGKAGPVDEAGPNGATGSGSCPLPGSGSPRD
jgi:predicted GNAT family acetyltransferase